MEKFLHVKPRSKKLDSECISSPVAGEKSRLLAANSNAEVYYPTISDVEAGCEAERKRSLEQSDKHRNKDFQLIHVPEGAVSVGMDIWEGGSNFPYLAGHDSCPEGLSG